MPLTGRSIRFDDDLYKKMMALAGDERSGSYHIRLACRQYLARLEPASKPKPNKPKPADINSGCHSDELEFDRIWAIYEKKGNRKTAKARYIKLSESDRAAIFKHAPLYVQSTPDRKYRKGFEVYINLECWNDEVIPNEGYQKPISQTITERATEQARAVWAECEAEEVREHFLPENDTLL